MAAKYFFLSAGWAVGRVWSTEGLWDELAWRRSPQIHRTQLSIIERGETLWLYRTEEAVLMVEVKQETPLAAVLATGEEEMAAPPSAASPAASKPFGQVVLKNLLNAEQVIDRLSNANAACHLNSGSKF